MQQYINFFNCMHKATDVNNACIQCWQLFSTYADDKTAADYDVVQMVSMQENPAYAEVHIIRTDNNYM